MKRERKSLWVADQRGRQSLKHRNKQNRTEQKALEEERKNRVLGHRERSLLVQETKSEPMSEISGPSSPIFIFYHSLSLSWSHGIYFLKKKTTTLWFKFNFCKFVFFINILIESCMPKMTWLRELKLELIGEPVFYSPGLPGCRTHLIPRGRSLIGTCCCTCSFPTNHKLGLLIFTRK